METPLKLTDIPYSKKTVTEIYEKYNSTTDEIYERIENELNEKNSLFKELPKSKQKKQIIEKVREVMEGNKTTFEKEISKYLKKYFFFSATTCECYFWNAKERMFEENLSKAFIIDSKLSAYGGEAQWKRLYEILRVHTEDDEYVHVWTTPDKPRMFKMNGKRYINVSLPFRFPPPDENLKFPDKVWKDAEYVITKVFYEIWAGGHKDQFEYIVQFISRAIQGIYNPTALYLFSHEQGIGKSTGLQVIKHLITGSEETEELWGGVKTMEQLVQYNDKVIRKAVVIAIDDIDCTGNVPKITGYLKSLLGNEDGKISVRRMYKDPENVKNNKSIIIAMNVLVNAEMNDHQRRVFCPDVSAKYKRNIPLFKKIKRLIEDEEVCHAIHTYFYDYYDPNFDMNKFPVTAVMKSMYATNSNLTTKYLLDLLRKGQGLVCTRVELYDRIKEYQRENYRGHNTISIQEMSRQLKELDIITTRHRMKSKGQHMMFKYSFKELRKKLESKITEDDDIPMEGYDDGDEEDEEIIPAPTKKITEAGRNHETEPSCGLDDEAVDVSNLQKMSPKKKNKAKLKKTRALVKEEEEKEVTPEEERKVFW